jgi:hypothetical protein
MKNLYLVIVLFVFGCKLKEDVLADGKKVPDNTSAVNSKSSNNANGWEKLSTVSATGSPGSTTGTMGQQIDAITSTDDRKRFVADSLDKAYLRIKKEKEDSLREVRLRDSIAIAERTNKTSKDEVSYKPIAAPPRRSTGSGTGSGSPSSRPKPSRNTTTTNSVKASKPVKQTEIDKTTLEYNETIASLGNDVDDFNTVFFKNKPVAAPERNSGVQGNTDGKTYTGKERFDEIEVNIPAIVPENVTVASSGTISLRTTKAAYIGQGITLPAGSTITGFADFIEDRMNINIRSFNINGRIVRINWKVYDDDGAEGMAISNAALKRNTSQGVNQTINAAGQLLSGAAGKLTGGMVRSVMSGSGRVSVAIDGGKKVIIKSNN